MVVVYPDVRTHNSICHPSRNDELTLFCGNLHLLYQNGQWTDALVFEFCETVQTNHTVIMTTQRHGSVVVQYTSRLFVQTIKQLFFHGITFEIGHWKCSSWCSSKALLYVCRIRLKGTKRCLISCSSPSFVVLLCCWTEYWSCTCKALFEIFICHYLWCSLIGLLP